MPMTRKYFIQHIHGMLEGKTGPEVAGNSQFYILKLFLSIANILRRFCLRLSLSSFSAFRGLSRMHVWLQASSTEQFGLLEPRGNVFYELCNTV